MSEDQRRNAERVPLDIPIEGKIGEIAVRIVEISLVGCLLEHADRMAMGSTFTVRFRWSGENVALKGRVARTEMRTIDGVLGYQSGVQFAESIDDSPDALQRVIRSLLPQSMPEIEAAAPSLFAEHPFFRHVDDEDEDEEVPPARRAPARPPLELELETQKPSEPVEQHDEIALELQPELDFEDVALPATLAGDEAMEFELDLPLPTPFVECTLADRTWTRRPVSEPFQPREGGFTIVRPDTDQELDELCHTYLVADPDTRRLIRVSFDLVNAKHGVAAE